MNINNPSVPPVTNSTTTAATALKQVSSQLGLGNDPASQGWGAAIKALQAGSTTMWTDSTGQHYVGFNCYFDGTLPKYINDGYAGYLFHKSNGELAFYLAGYGTAGSTVSATNRLSLGYDGTMTSGRAAATNYTRKSPNFQLLTGAVTTPVTITAGLNTVAAPSGATAVLLNITCTANAAATVTSRYVQVLSYGAGGVTNLGNVGYVLAHEYSGLGAGTNLAITVNQAIVPVFSGNFYLYALFDAGGNSNAQFALAGYWD